MKKKSTPIKFKCCLDNKKIYFNNLISVLSNYKSLTDLVLFYFYITIKTGNFHILPAEIAAAMSTAFVFLHNSMKLCKNGQFHPLLFRT